MGGTSGAGIRTNGEPEYRDRAKERQEGKGEYERIAVEFENQADIDRDQSKYLGGDLEHTHLVKGLDFALLSKVRGEINKHDKAGDVARQRAERKAQQRDATKKFESP